MSIDVYVKSTQLLEKLANAIHDREPNGNHMFAFKTSDLAIVESWLIETMNEAFKKMAEY